MIAVALFGIDDNHHDVGIGFPTRRDPPTRTDGIETRRFEPPLLKGFERLRRILAKQVQTLDLSFWLGRTLGA